MGMLDFILGKGPKEPDMSGVDERNRTVLDGLSKEVPQDYQKVTPNQLSEGDIERSQVGPSAYDNISSDPRLRDAQYAALNKLGDVSQNGGMTLADKANLNHIQSQAAQNDRGRREAIMQGAAQRGNLDSGAAIGAQLASSQAANQQESQAGMDVAGQAQRRALDAMQQQGQMAGQMDERQFQQQAQAAQAKDRIAQYNAGARADASRYNIGAQNQGQQYNASAGNQFQQNQFQNRATVAGYQGNQATNEGNRALGMYQSKAAAHQHQEDNLLNGAMTGGMAAMSVMSDERVKTGVKSTKPVDIDAFLTSISPKDFKYKDPTHGKGDRVGVMAQDLEKTDMGGKLVHEAPEGKALDVNNVIGALLQSVAHLHKTKANK